MDVAAGFGAASALLLGVYVAWLLSVGEIVDNTISRFDWLICLMFGLATLVAISPAVFLAMAFMRRSPRFGAWRIAQAIAMLTAAGLVLHWNLASWNILRAAWRTRLLRPVRRNRVCLGRNLYDAQNTLAQLNDA